MNTHGDDRVEALLAELTLEERAALTGGDDVWHLPAIQRLGIGRLKMSDGPSGVRGRYFGTRRSLSFPCGMAVGATWDVELVGRYGEALAGEARAKGVHVLLGPTVCIPRTPLGGRTFESFAEDPTLSAALTVAYVRGVQAHGVAACVKHFACNDQEHERMTISVEVDERALREIHLPSFEAAVLEAGVWSIMSAYNRLHGTYCGEHPELLGRILKEEWGFDGLVVSDWFGTHSTTAAAVAGLDVEMPGPPAFLGATLAAAVEAGEVSAEVVEEQARRILRVAARTGLLDHTPPEGEEQDPEDPARRAVARQLVVAGTVLLRNEPTGNEPARGERGDERGDERVLPLAPAVRTIAVIGPGAARLETGGGGSSQVTPHRVTSLIEELSERRPDVRLVHEPGCDLTRGIPTADDRVLPDGFRLEYLDAAGAVAHTDVLHTGRFVTLGDPAPGVPVANLHLRAVGPLRPTSAGAWRLGVASAGTSRVLLDGVEVLDNTAPTPGDTFFGAGSTQVTAEVELDAGRIYEVTIELRGNGLPIAGFEFGAVPPPVESPLERAVAAAADADVAVVVVGSNAHWETEGMDRADLRLIGGQDELVARIAEANPRTVVVVNAGAPVEMPWAQDVAAILMAWYPGEEGGAALADLLCGLEEPGGRLPITFPRRLEDNPTHGGGYPGEAGVVRYVEGLLVGYRHYDAHDIEPLFPFGHGLGYTTFEYGQPTVAVDGTDVTVTVPVTNSGGRAGTEVVQVYVHDLDARVPRPPRELRAFTRVGARAGETVDAVLHLDRRAFAHWDVTSQAWTVDPGRFELWVGASSRDLRVSAVVEIDG